MKRFVLMVLCAAVLSGCGCADIPEITEADTEGTTAQNTAETISYADETAPVEIPAVTSAATSAMTAVKAADTEETSPVPDEIRYVTLPQTEKAVFSGKEYTFVQAENMSDEELIALAESDFTTETYIPDYYPVNRQAAPVTLSADDDFEAYCADISHYPSAYEDNAIDVVLEKVGENEYYAEWRNAYTEIREYYSNDEPVCSYIEREYFSIMLKNFRRVDGKVKYMGEMSEEEIRNNFDISEAYNYPQKLCRRVTVTEDGAYYEYIYFQRCGGDWGIDDTASLYLNKIHISSDGEVSAVVNNGLIKECEIPGTAPTNDWYY